MNEISITHSSVYRNQVAPMDVGQNVGTVAGGEGAGKVSTFSSSGVTVMETTGASMPRTQGAGGSVHVIGVPQYNAGCTTVDAMNSLAAFLAGLQTKTGQEDQAVVNPGGLRRNERLAAKQAEDEKNALRMFDTFQCMALFNTSNCKMSKVLADLKILNQKSMSVNAEKRAEAAATPKKLGFLIASVVLQVASASVSSAASFAASKDPSTASNAVMMLKGDGAQFALDMTAKTLSFAPSILKYFEDGEGADRKAVKENQAEAIHGMMQAGRAMIDSFSTQVYKLADATNKMFSQVLRSENALQKPVGA